MTDQTTVKGLRTPDGRTYGAYILVGYHWVAVDTIEAVTHNTVTTTTGHRYNDADADRDTLMARLLNARHQVGRF